MKKIQSNIEEKINAYISDNNVTGMVCDHLLSNLNQDGDYWWYLEPDGDDKLTPEDREMVEDYIRNNFDYELNDQCDELSFEILFGMEKEEYKEMYRLSDKEVEQAYNEREYGFNTNDFKSFDEEYKNVEEFMERSEFGEKACIDGITYYKVRNQVDDEPYTIYFEDGKMEIL